jgi:hypothetical protein
MLLWSLVGIVLGNEQSFSYVIHARNTRIRSQLETTHETGSSAGIASDLQH